MKRKKGHYTERINIPGGDADNSRGQSAAGASPSEDDGE